MCAVHSCHHAVLWRAVHPFIDANTQRKLVFVHKKDPPGRLNDFFRPDTIDDTMGGTVPINALLDAKAYEQRMESLDAAMQLAVEQAAVCTAECQAA